jgi:hypothetical protein
MFAKKFCKRDVFPGNVSVLEAPSIPLLWLNRLLVPVDTAAVLSFGMVLVLCSSRVALPWSSGDATALHWMTPEMHGANKERELMSRTYVAMLWASMSRASS